MSGKWGASCKNTFLQSGKQRNQVLRSRPCRTDLFFEPAGTQKVVVMIRHLSRTHRQEPAKTLILYFHATENMNRGFDRCVTNQKPGPGPLAETHVVISKAGQALIIHFEMAADPSTFFYAAASPKAWLLRSRLGTVGNVCCVFGARRQRSHTESLRPNMHKHKRTATCTTDITTHSPNIAPT